MRGKEWGKGKGNIFFKKSLPFENKVVILWKFMRCGQKSADRLPGKNDGIV
jgi:hypothetical protein